MSEHENGRNRQITDEIKQRKEHKFGSEFAKNIEPGRRDFTDQKFFQESCRRGGYTQLELAETLVKHVQIA